jgi:hypothetical protein
MSEPQAAPVVEKPKPQIFAIMRNAHEVIRGGMVDIQQAIEAKDMATAKTTWEKTIKFEALHKTMEEGSTDGPSGFFK